MTHNYYLSEKNALEVIMHYDIIIDATDNFDTRHLIDKYCCKLHKTYIYGAINKFEGQVATLNYKNGIRYKNIYSKNLVLENNTCIRNGVMGITTGYIGILQTTETIKIILGLNKKCKNLLLSYDLITIKNKEKKIYIKRNKKLYLEIDKIKLNNRTIEINKQNLMVDLRNQYEFSKKHKNRSVNIPLSKLKLNKTIKLIKQYCKHQTLTLSCNNNEKSVIGSYILNNNQIANFIYND